MKMIDDRKQAQEFFNAWIGSRGPKGWVGRYLSNTGRWYTDMLIKEGQVTPADRILDVGCGSGSMIIRLIEKVSPRGPIYGVEPTAAQLRLAKKNLAATGLSGRAVVNEGFAAPLPFEDAYFDLVYCSFVFKHMADDTLAGSLNEIYRVLKRGGRFVGWEFAEVTNSLMRREAEAPGRGMRLRDFPQLESFLSEAGFTDIEEFEVKKRGFWDPVMNVGVKATKGPAG